MTTIRSRQQGVTLIELMVAIVIASLLAIAVASVLAGFEGRKRATTSVNDINQTGNYAAWVLDALLRGAGSGFAQTHEFSFGCKLLVSKGGASSSSAASSAASGTVLPRSSALPAPFAGMGQTFRLAPVLIKQDGTTPGESGAGSDALVIMSGAAGNAEVPAYLTDYPAASALTLRNTLSFSQNDVLLLVDTEVSSTGPAPCMVSQVASGFAQAAGTSLPLSGIYYSGSIDSKSVTDFTKDSVALNLGNPGSANPPSFSVLGVGDNNTLYSYDLLQMSGTPLLPIAQGVFEMHAIYGVDTDSNGTVDSWEKPEGVYAYETLTDGTQGSAGVIATIKAIRIGLIMRTDVREKEAVSSGSLTLFSDLGTDREYSPTLSGNNPRYRYRTVEFTVPVRNAMMLE